MKHQYPKEVLETWRTGRLGCLYMNSYTIARGNPEETSQLETIAQILSSRPISNRRELFKTIKKNLKVNYSKYGKDLLMGMLGHYIKFVMQPNSN